MEAHYSVRGNHHQIRGRGSRARYSRPFCHICKKNDHTTYQHRSIIQGIRESTSKNTNTNGNSNTTNNYHQIKHEQAEVSAVSSKYTQVKDESESNDEAIYEAYCLSAQEITEDLENIKLIYKTSEIQALEHNNSNNKNHEWGLDTMASLHVTNDLSTLSDIKEAQPVRVTVADGTEYIAKTTGTIQLKMLYPRLCTKYSTKITVRRKTQRRWFQNHKWK
jgi:hypothetical protein